MTPPPARVPPRFSTWTWMDWPGETKSVNVRWGTGRVLASQRRSASLIARRVARSARVAKIAAHRAKRAVAPTNATQNWPEVTARLAGRCRIVELARAGAG